MQHYTKHNPDLARPTVHMVNGKIVVKADDCRLSALTHLVFSSVA
jgi:hypothetical protein